MVSTRRCRQPCWNLPAARRLSRVSCRSWVNLNRVYYIVSRLCGRKAKELARVECRAKEEATRRDHCQLRHTAAPCILYRPSRRRRALSIEFDIRWKRGNGKRRTVINTGVEKAGLENGWGANRRGGKTGPENAGPNRTRGKRRTGQRRTILQGPPSTEREMDKHKCIMYR